MFSKVKELIRYFFNHKNAFCSCLSVSVFLWMVVFIIFGGYQNIGFFSGLCELVLDFSVVVLSWFVYKRCEQGERKYFLFLSLGFLAILITDISFIYVYDIDRKSVV